MGDKTYSISEEVLQRGIADNPDRIGKYIYYNIGNTTIGSLAVGGLIADMSYEDADRKPDGLIVDEARRVIAVIENKSLSKYKTEKHKQDATLQALSVARDLGAKIVISTDSVNSLWYSVYSGKPVLNADGSQLKETFGITTSNTPKMELLIDMLDSSISPSCSQISAIEVTDPTPLAYSIWQKIFKATNAPPE